MPSLGADMEAGTLVEWLKHPGEPVHRGDVIAVVDTDKGAIEIEVFQDGVLDRVVVEPGHKAPVGAVLAWIRGEHEPAGAVTPAPPSSAEAPRVTPGARQAARERGVVLAGVTGSGPDSSITKEDVERAASRRRVLTATDRSAGMRQAIAAAMSRAKREIPHLYLSLPIDMTSAVTWLAAQNDQRPVEHRLLPIALLLKAVARAAIEVPEMNGFWVENAFRAGGAAHVGCAIALRGGGLVAPAIHDADRKTLDEVMTAVMDLTARARVGGLRSSELTDATITVSNFGELGAESGYAIIYPPQVAMVAFGRITERPWAVQGKLEVRTATTATVSADHRAVDGRRAGQFLAAIERWLQRPEGL
jgi:pyruvate dehydrogenase E2 component (dihydrolipoamide acetyltransferase)